LPGPQTLNLCVTVTSFLSGATDKVKKICLDGNGLANNALVVRVIRRGKNLKKEKSPGNIISKAPSATSVTGGVLI
jgi:hypothetical protein